MSGRRWWNRRDARDMGWRGLASRPSVRILRLGPRIFALWPGKLCPSCDVKGANRAEFANVRESRPLRFARRSPPAGVGRAKGLVGRVHGGECTAEVRRRCGGSVATKIVGADGAG